MPLCRSVRLSFCLKGTIKMAAGGGKYAFDTLLICSCYAFDMLQVPLIVFQLKTLRVLAPKANKASMSPV
ncbi:hypothetical protein EG028_04305 [Chitinophaga barathri]|uniref:Uncharacterized protein n=1 Tax=Chitinophaga barathri TaxID=1647451 RepID=A0A3N4MKF7_9BACT|nr:hypothetical protein EG028_04305 [Chitinophaga barathri]